MTSPGGPSTSLQHERHQGQDRAREQPAKTVELGAPQPDLPADFRDEPLENRLDRAWTPPGQRSITAGTPLSRAPLIVCTSSMS